MTRRGPRPHLRRTAVAVGGLATLAGGIVASVQLTAQIRPEHDGDAVVACRQAVENRLALAPAPDGFGVAVSRVTVTSSPGGYQVTGRTASVGARGAVDFGCRVAYRPGPDSHVRVEELKAG